MILDEQQLRGLHSFLVERLDFLTSLVSEGKVPPDDVHSCLVAHVQFDIKRVEEDLAEFDNAH